MDFESHICNGLTFQLMIIVFQVKKKMKKKKKSNQTEGKKKEKPLNTFNSRLRRPQKQ